VQALAWSIVRNYTATEGVISMAGKVIAGLVESNGRVTAKKPGSAQWPMLAIQYWTTSLYYTATAPLEQPMQSSQATLLGTSLPACCC